MAGIPDANCCWKGNEFWLEGKAIEELPVRESTLVRVGLRQEQVDWIKTRHAAGGNVAIWVRVKHKGWWLFFEHMADKLMAGIPKSEFVEHPYAFKKTDTLAQCIKDMLCLNS